MTTIRAILASSPVVPVLTIDDPMSAVPLARALLAGGIPVLEVTLRTPAALAAVERIRAEVEGALVGVGTVTSAADLERARAAGARFAVSPGFTPALGHAAAASGLPLLPGVATASELLLARAAGYDALKFFPAEVAGGIAALRAFRPVFPDVVFCPTGGVTPDNMAAYLAQANVVAVGGSWLAPAAWVAAGDWAAITAAATRAVARAAAPVGAIDSGAGSA